MIKLNVEALNRAIKTKGWTDQKAAEKMQVSATQLWRVRLPVSDPRHNEPGQDFIAGALTAFGVKFEELFVLAEEHCTQTDS